MIVILGLTCVVFALVSMWKENRFGWPLRGIIWFTLAIAGSCAVIALLAGYGAAVIDRNSLNAQHDKWANAMAGFEQHDREMPPSPGGYRVRRKLHYHAVEPYPVLSEYASRQSWAGHR